MEENAKDRLDTTAMSADEAHAMLGGDAVISRAAFYQAIKRKEVPHLRLGKRILIPRRAFSAWLQGNMEGVRRIVA
jgi:excisionase family DNA binding protein